MIGAGVIVDGALLRGTTGSAGEIGLSRQTRTDQRSLDRAAGADALVQRYLELGGDRSGADVSLIIAAASEGEPAALAAFDDVIDQIAVAVANAVLVVDPKWSSLAVRSLCRRSLFSSRCAVGFENSCQKPRP